MRRTITLWIAVALTGCANRSRVASLPPASAQLTPIEPAEYEVYRQILATEGQSTPVFVLAEANLQVSGTTAGMTSRDSELTQAFEKALERPGRIDSIALGAPWVHIVHGVMLPGWPMDYQEQLRQWDSLHARYGPDIKFVRFSRVGFNRTRTRAEVIYVARDGPACYFVEEDVVLVRVRGRWSPILESASYC